MASLNQLGLIDGHIVTEVVKSQLVVGAVGNIRSIGDSPLCGLHTGNNQAHGKAHVAVDLAHPLRVTLCQVFVDGDHMDTLTGQCI